MPTTAATTTPVYVAGNSTVHAGRKIGNYASGAPRYAKLCGSSRNDRHDPSPAGDGAEVTCRRCLAKIPAAVAERVSEIAAEPVPDRRLARKIEREIESAIDDVEALRSELARVQHALVDMRDRGLDAPQ